MIMNNNNLLKLSFAQGSNNNANNISAKMSKSSPQSGFKSVLDSAVNNSGRRLDNNTSDSSRNNADDNSQNTKVKYNSFREVQMSQRNASSKVTSRSDVSEGTSNVNSEVEKSVSGPEEYDEQMSALAQMLGITPGQLADLAKKLGYSQEDLKDVKKLAEFMDKVSSLLELDDNERETLIKLAEEVSRQTKSEKSALISDISDINTQNEATGENVLNSKEGFDISKISASIKEKLDALIENGKNTPELISNEVAQIVSAMRAQSKVSLDSQKAAAGSSDDSENTVSVAADVSEKNDADKLANAKEAAKETHTDNTDDGGTKFDLNSATASTQAATTGDQNLQQDQQNLQVAGEIKAVLANNEVHTEKSIFSMRQPIRTSEVLNQVVEQAKVILGQDKTEMVIQLKPDHLGKLELKVVTEQGIVAAKFIAENQKVKEIIETNMQLLKDSLQKQGISVEGVSVQVGQDSRGENRNTNLFQSRSNENIGTAKYGSGMTGNSVSGISVLENLPERLAQYTTDANTINLTA